MTDGRPEGDEVRQWHEWAVRVHCEIRGIAGPHLLDCTDEQLARVRFQWWLSHRPDVRCELLTRTVTATHTQWRTV